ncbi:MAG: toxic anion resistance protein [Lachnospirales bacterium]
MSIDLEFDELVNNVSKEDNVVSEIVPTASHSNESALVFEETNKTEGTLKVSNKGDYEVDKEFLLDTLSDNEKKEVLDFVDKIELDKTASVMAYGQKSQKKLENMSNNMIKEVRLKDVGLVGDSITKLVQELKGIEAVDEDKSFFAFMKPKNIKNKVENYKIKYGTVEKNIDNIVGEMNNHKVNLIRDIHNLDNLYELNKEQFKELTMYIVAGEEKLKRFYKEDIEKKRAEAVESNSQVTAQELQDLISQANRFEKRLHDLKLSRIVCLQFAPQIRLIQNNDTELLEKIQSTVNNSIPIWRSNMIISMGLENSRKALEAQKAVTDMTNDLLKKNSELLKQGSIEIAKETERGIIDLETIQLINNNLISTLNEVVVIHRDGIEKRKNVEIELHSIENNLKKQILTTADERIAIANK